MPLTKAGHAVANLAVHQSVHRTWTGDEVAQSEVMAERTWAAVERSRTEAALRASEERLRRMLNIDGIRVLIFEASSLMARLP